MAPPSSPEDDGVKDGDGGPSDQELVCKEVLDEMLNRVVKREEEDAEEELPLKRRRKPSRRKAEADEAEKIVEGKDKDLARVRHRVPWVVLDREEVNAHLRRNLKGWQVRVDRSRTERILRRQREKTWRKKEKKVIEVVQLDSDGGELVSSSPSPPLPAEDGEVADSRPTAEEIDRQPKSRCVKIEDPSPSPSSSSSSSSPLPKPIATLNAGCLLCHKSFHKMDGLVDHLTEVEFFPVMDKLVRNTARAASRPVCPLCKEHTFLSSDKGDIVHHFNSVHKLMWRLHFEVSKQLQDLEVHRSAYVCRRCGTVFSSRTAYNCHWRVVHRNADENLEILSQVPHDHVCRLCLVGISGASFTSHLKSEHFGIVLQKTVGGVRVCPYCGNDLGHATCAHRAWHIGVGHREILKCYNDAMVFDEFKQHPTATGEERESLTREKRPNALEQSEQQQQPPSQRQQEEEEEEEQQQQQKQQLLQQEQQHASALLTPRGPPKRIPILKVRQSPPPPPPQTAPSTASPQPPSQETRDRLSLACKLCKEEPSESVIQAFESRECLRKHLREEHFPKVSESGFDDLLRDLKLEGALEATTTATTTMTMTLGGEAQHPSSETAREVIVKSESLPLEKTRRRRRLTRRFCKSFAHLRRCCLCDFRESSNQANNRKREMMAHLFWAHFRSAVVNDLFGRVRRVGTDDGCIACPGCKESRESFDDLAEHWAVDHRRVLYSYEPAWEAARAAKAEGMPGRMRRRGSQEKDEEEEEEEGGESCDSEREEEEQARRVMLTRVQRELAYWSDGGGRGRAFVQRHPCHLVRDLQPCRECSKVQAGLQNPGASVCQFEGFRKLVYRFGRFTREGFLSPFVDSSAADRELWLPLPEVALEGKEDFGEGTALFILNNVADEFCHLVRQEKQMEEDYLAMSGRSESDVIWKRLEEQVREMCDVCSTTLFNVHFTCPSCCVLVCLDCFQTRLRGKTEYSSAAAVTPYRSQRRRKILQEGRDNHMWPFCHRGRPHDPSGLLLTKIIPNDAHLELRELLHRTLSARGRRPTCVCFQAGQHEKPKEAGAAVARVVTEMVEKVANMVDTAAAAAAAAAAATATAATGATPVAPLKRRKVEGESAGSHILSISEDGEVHRSPTGSEAGSSDASSTAARGSPTSSTKKKVSLRVDQEGACKCCGQDFLIHQLGYPQKRTHFLTHFREAIGRKVAKRPDEAGMFQCPEEGCDVAHKNRRFIIQPHLSAAHGYLDRLYFGGNGSPGGSPAGKAYQAKTLGTNPKPKIEVEVRMRKGQECWVEKKKRRRPDPLPRGEVKEASGTRTPPIEKKLKLSIDEYKQKRRPLSPDESTTPRPPPKTKTSAEARRRGSRSPRDSSRGDGGEKRRSSKRERRESSRHGRSPACPRCGERYHSGYHHHMALQHFREQLERLAPPSRSLRCYCGSFQGRNADDLLVHLARDHKRLQWLQRRERQEGGGRSNGFDINSLVETVPGGSSSLSVRYQCRVSGCARSSESQAKMLHHAKDHVVRRAEQALKDNVDRNSTIFVCPFCYEEKDCRKDLEVHFRREHLEPGDLVGGGPEGGSGRSRSKKAGKTLKELLKERFHGLDGGGDGGGGDGDGEEKEASELDLISSFIEADCAARAGVVNERRGGDGDGVSETERWKRKRPPQSEERLWLNALSRRCYPLAGSHEWLCEGKLLLLDHPRNKDNLEIFQDHWLRGQPVVIANSSELLNTGTLWHPSSFRRDFGHLRHTLINCLTGRTVPGARLRDFWEGFEMVGRRLVDSEGAPMVLKLKDWPPNDDIAEYMPRRFADLINSFPMPQYTLREGYLNLASFLPERYLKPELGPKMYIAYGSALHDNKASTNLHIDMSDAVNVMVHVGIPGDTDRASNEEVVYRDIDNAGCDIDTKLRCRLSAAAGKLPGALWHIYHPRDTPKIRTFLKRVAVEKGRRLDPHDDPIHDQSTYLDGPLRLRLYREYGVRGYPIVQCMGDTVFIPAGACHQVRNLHNCIKVAEDFVSPENISHCLHLTQEFRHLTEWHTNHEDKLQIKSILYHSVKTALARLNKD